MGIIFSPLGLKGWMLNSVAEAKYSNVFSFLLFSETTLMAKLFLFLIDFKYHSSHELKNKLAALN